MNTILDSVEAYIFIKDKDLKYQYANRQVLKLFKLNLDSVIGRTDYDLFDKSTADTLKVFDNKVIKSGKRAAQEEMSFLPDKKKAASFLVCKSAVI